MALASGHQVHEPGSIDVMRSSPNRQACLSGRAVPLQMTAAVSSASRLI
jgi:hypothetical protein